MPSPRKIARKAKPPVEPAPISVVPDPEVTDETLHAQKMESLGMLAGGMAHDMNNILASIMAVASAMEAEITDAHPFADDIRDILNACRRGSRLTRSLLSFARRHLVNFTDVNVNEIVSEVESILSRTVSKDITINSVLAGDLNTISADPDQLNQVLMNICLNAVDAMGNQGTLVLETWNTHLSTDDLHANPDAKPGDYVRIAISDTGPGIPAHLRDKVFEPFFTTKPRGKGTGLGLSMAYGTIKKHGGIIRIDPDYRDGTSFLIDLPIAPPAANGSEPARLSDQMARPRTKTGLILLVDDEELFLGSSRRILEKLGHQVLCCRNGQEAIDLFARRGADIDLVILDMIMPIMGGREAFYQIKKIRDDVPIIIASGVTEQENIRDMLKDGAIGFIPKPFDMKSLSGALQRLQNH